jgi:hypothetical protein
VCASKPKRYPQRPWFSAPTPDAEQEAPRPRPFETKPTREDAAQKYILDVDAVVGRVNPKSMRFACFERDLELPGTGARSAEVPQFAIARGTRRRAHPPSSSATPASATSGRRRRDGVWDIEHRLLSGGADLVAKQ